MQSTWRPFNGSWALEQAAPGDLLHRRQRLRPQNDLVLAAVAVELGDAPEDDPEVLHRLAARQKEPAEVEGAAFVAREPGEGHVVVVIGRDVARDLPP